MNELNDIIKELDTTTEKLSSWYDRFSEGFEMKFDGDDKFISTFKNQIESLRRQVLMLKVAESIIELQTVMKDRV